MPIAHQIGIGALLLLFATQPCRAEHGLPIAIRSWPGQAASIESFWGLRIAIDLPTAADHQADLRLYTAGPEAAEQPASGIVHYGVNRQGRFQTLAAVLDRLPGEAMPKLTSVDKLAQRSAHAAGVTAIEAGADDKDQPPTAIYRIEIDGVRIIIAGRVGPGRLSRGVAQRMRDVDVLVLAVSDPPSAAALVEQLNPRLAVPLSESPDALEQFADSLPETAVVVRARGNTLAVAAAGQMRRSNTQAVLLQNTPWSPPKELAELLKAKEQACQASQQAFASLSAPQLNFRPANGTHTPRWNVEHMAGRELLFFTQIFAEQDSQFRVVDLNPAQMPADYLPAHPDWDGGEEARHMQRVASFTRRFAYLLADLDLDQPAPGTFWTPRRLLQQMERHYGEHTANVARKLKLPEFPSE